MKTSLPFTSLSATQFRSRTHNVEQGNPRSFTVLKNWSLILALLAIGVFPVLAQPIVQPGSPDFYQHQTTENQANSGWCFYTAFEDAMYYDANHGFPNLYANNANWVTAMNNNLTTAINTADSGYPSFFMNKYISDQGYAATLGESTILNSGGGYSIYDSFTQNLNAGSNVLVHIVQNAGVSNQWWGFHVMDAVGYSASNHTIMVLDPDNNRYGAYGFPGTNANPPSSGFYTNGFNVGVPYNLVDYTNTQPIPIESGFGGVGNPTNSLLQQYTVDANGVITDGIYAGTQIDAIFAIGPVPEPSSFALLLGAALAFGGFRVARRKKLGLMLVLVACGLIGGPAVAQTLNSSFLGTRWDLPVAGTNTPGNPPPISKCWAALGILAFGGGFATGTSGN